MIRVVGTSESKLKSLCLDVASSGPFSRWHHSTPSILYSRILSGRGWSLLLGAATDLGLCEGVL